MNRKKNKIVLLFAALFVLTACCQQEKKEHLSGNTEKTTSNQREFVPDSTTAKRIAEAVWLPIYGEGIYDRQPFIATLCDSVWIVTGTLPRESIGGVPYIEIQKKDGRVLKVTHGK